MKGLSRLKRAGAAGLVCCLLAGPAAMLPAAGGSAEEVDAVTVLSGNWEASSWYADNGGRDNCLAVSGVYIPASTPFVYEADVLVENGAAGALAFAVSEDGTDYSCVNVDKSARVAHAFGKFGSFDKALTEAQQGQAACHLKVELDRDMKLTYWVDGEEIGSLTAGTGAAGYLGLNTYYAKTLFENVTYTVDGVTKPVTGFAGKTGSWTRAYTGGNRSAENCVALSGVSVPAGASFTYEADVQIRDGLAASLVFGTAADGSGLSAACVDRGSGLAHVFGQYGSFNKPLTDSQKTAFSYHIKLTGGDGGLSYYLDGVLVGTLSDVTVPGFLGLCTYQSRASFYNVRYTLGGGQEETDPPALPEQGLRPVSGWTAVSGGWEVSGEEILASNTGLDNCILRSGVRIPANTGFLYEADVTVRAGSAGALVFGYQGEGGWCAASYDISSRLAHVFGGYAAFSQSLTAAQLAQSTHRLRLYLDPSMTLFYYVDDTLIGSAALSSFEGGYLGLNTYHSETLFSNVRYTVLEAPRLTGLSFAEGEFLEPFSTDRLTYTARVDAAVETIHVTAGAEEGTAVEIGGCPAQSGVPCAVELEDGETRIPLTLTGQNGVTAIVTICVNRIDSQTQYRDTHRPQLHFTALENWINDPNGLVYDAATGLYHLYFQYSHSVTAGDRTSWGHATSSDLVHWTELPPAILPDSLGLIWSGSCVIDRNNTSGLFDASTDPDSRIVALYSYDRQTQALAYSTDGGVSFVKYPGNPVIPNPDRQYGADFRDPKVIWVEDDSQEAGGVWLMVVGCSPYRLFTSPDLIHWTYNSDIVTKTGSPFGGECPDLFPLALDGNEARTKWVLCAAGRQYLVGDLVKEEGTYTFRDETGVLEPMNGNSDTVYASQTFYNDPQGRRILVSWLRDSSAERYEDKNWNGALSIPVELTLATVNGGVRLLTRPVSELDGLRSGDPVFELTESRVEPGGANPMEGVEGTLFDLEAVIRLEDADGFGFRVREAEAEYAEIAYSAADRRLSLTTVRNGETTVSSMRLTPLEGNRIKLRILLDNSLVDVFGNDGAAAVTSFLFPDKDGRAVSFFAQGGAVTMESLRLYELSSSWNNGYDTAVETPAEPPAGPSTPSQEASGDTSRNPETGRGFRDALLSLLLCLVPGTAGVVWIAERRRRA